MIFQKRGEATARIMKMAYKRETVSHETKPIQLKPGQCPRCYDQIGRGFWMHVRHCKGIKNGQNPLTA